MPFGAGGEEWWDDDGDSKVSYMMLSIELVPVAVATLSSTNRECSAQTTGHLSAVDLRLDSKKHFSQDTLGFRNQPTRECCSRGTAWWDHRGSILQNTV